MDVYAPECSDFMTKDFLTSAISNLVSAIISLLIGIATSILYRHKFHHTKQAQSSQLKIEHKLLIQTVWSSSMFGFYAFLSLFDGYFYRNQDKDGFFVINQIYRLFYDIAYLSYHYGSVILLFVFS